MLSNDQATSNDFSIDSPPAYETMNMEEINELLPKKSQIQSKSPESNKSNEGVEYEDFAEQDPLEVPNDSIDEEGNEQEAELKIPLKVRKMYKKLKKTLSHSAKINLPTLDYVIDEQDQISEQD